MLHSLALSLALGPLTQDPDLPPDPRAAIEWVASLGYHAVQIDAARQGIRPRELDRSARRDLASLLRRKELALSGLDLFIPPGHFTDPAHIDRAVAAVRDTIELASELAALIPASTPASIPCVSLTFPTDLADDTRDELAAHAARTGAQLADHAIQDQTDDTPASFHSHALGVGIDPAALILRGLDPAQAVAKAGTHLFAARLTDAAHGSRIAPDSSGSQLDRIAYAATLDVVGYIRPLIVDLRNIPNPASAAKALAPDRMT